MNIIINQQKLQTAVRSVERIVSKNISLPILNTILLQTDKGKLKLTTTNLEIGIRYWIDAKIEKEGVLALPARVFSEFINSVQDEKVALVAEKNTLIITSEHYKTQILGMVPDEFPIIPTLHNAVEFSVHSSVLKTALASVLESTSLLETRPELTGVYVHTGASEITFAATDSFRLSECVLKAPIGVSKAFIVPRTTAQEIMRLAGDHNEDIRIAVSENQISARGADFELVSRLIDGRYPDYKKIIPEKFNATVLIAKDEFERSIRMASIFSSSISDVILKTTNNTLQLMAKNSDRGEISATMTIAGGKTPFEVSVNYRYLLDGLKSIPTNTVLIGYTGQGSPLVLKGENRDDFVYVIMPLRT